MTTSDTAGDVKDSSNQENDQGSSVPKKSYRTIISMIAGSLIGNDTSMCVIVGRTFVKAYPPLMPDAGGGIK